MIVVIPYKGQPEQTAIAKGRLAALLSPEQRQMLAEAMFVSVFKAWLDFDAANPNQLQQLVVVSKDRNCLAPLQGYMQQRTIHLQSSQTENVKSKNKNKQKAKQDSISRNSQGYCSFTLSHFAEPDSCSDLNAALEAALQSLEAQNRSAAADQTSSASSLPSQCLIMHADLPLTEAADIASIMQDAAGQSGRQAIHLVQDKSRTGTNALVLPLPSPIPLCFGENSASKHLQQAMLLAEQGIKLHIVQQRQLAFDLDEADDLMTLLAYHKAQYFSAQHPLTACLDSLQAALDVANK